MNSFSFYNPTRVHFGVGMLNMLGKEIKQAGYSKILLIAGGGSIRTNGVHEQVLSTLKNNNIDWIEAWGVQTNPTLDKVRELIALAQKEKVDCLLAVGGGSVIDTAKAVAAGFYLNDVWNAFLRTEQISKALPLYTVLTLSATGSEMNGNAVITNEAERKKWAIASPLLYPVATIIDPSFQNSLPQRQTVNGALDATAHILEYLFIDSNSLATIAIDEALLLTVMECTDRLLIDPT
ncbi:MAG: iron-containing alcohol dehydrogenase, partial [Candidatus Cloacimonadaceae bacterium]|nr:iron-containing alcohol dehydrogenase [Candidatus Cloacimonadaceae bacterium]